MKKVLSLLLSILILSTIFVLPICAVEGSYIPEMEGEYNRTMKNIKLSDGTDTGVRYTNFKLDGYYCSEGVTSKEVNVLEADLSDTHLSFEVINHGACIVNKATVKDAVLKYTTDEKTVVGAVNGDLWMTNVHSNSNNTKKTLEVTRGTLIIDREIWASEQLNQENLDATNGEKGKPSPAKPAFGVTSKNQPLVGSPIITTSIKDTTNGNSFNADGINRLPANNALIFYNYRVNGSNYALNDSLEIELTTADGKLSLDKTVKATVKAIYEPGSTTRPSIRENTIVLTARGTRIADLEAVGIKVGDELEFNVSLEDRFGNTELWYDVEDAIGGNIIVMNDGEMYTPISSSDEYPVAFIGIKDDGKVMITTITSNVKNRGGIVQKQALEFCKSMGYNSVFYLDGGGSTTMVTLNEGDYTVRNYCCDSGKPRTVINSVAICYNQTPVCEKQGSLSYIDVPVDKSIIFPSYLDGGLLADISTNKNGVACTYDLTEKAMKMTTEKATNDPYATINFTDMKPISADDYKYIVIKAKTDSKVDGTLGIYYSAGDIKEATPGLYVSNTLKSEGGYQYLVYDMSSVNNWTGNINGLRLDIFDNASVEKDVSIWFKTITLCKNLTEVEQVKTSDWIPEDDGVMTNYYEYKLSLKPQDESEDIAEPQIDNSFDYMTIIIFAVGGAVLGACVGLVAYLITKKKKNK